MDDNLVHGQSGASAPEPVTLVFSSQVYSLDTLKRAAIKFSDRCSFDFIPDGNDFHISMTFPDSTNTAQMREIESEYKVEILDQDIRHTIALETESVRNLILANVFSQTGLAEP